MFWSSPKYNHGTATERGDSVMVSGVHGPAVVSGGTAASDGSGGPPDGDGSGDPQPPRSTSANSPKRKGPGRRRRRRRYRPYSSNVSYVVHACMLGLCLPAHRCG